MRLRQLRNFIKFMFTRMSQDQLFRFKNGSYITQKQFDVLCWIKFNLWN